MCFPVRKRTCELSMLNEELRINDESNKTCAEQPLKYLSFYGLFNKPNHFKSLQTSKTVFGFQKLIPIYIVKGCLLQFNFFLVLSWILCVKYDQETSCQILCFKLLAFVLHHPKYSHISRYFLVFPKIETFQSFIETLYWNQVGKYLFESKNKDIRTTPT